MEQPAMLGGPKAKTVPFGSGKRFGREEADELLEALQQGTLFYHFGEKVKTFLSDFNKLYGISASVAASSGTAALHTALGAAGITVGDEVITSPITDQGTIVGVLYQNAIPVFADLEPHSFNLSPEAIEKKITSRTKAIIAVHLAGNPCRMDEILSIAKKHRLIVIEDCAQSYLAKYKGKLTGTLGDYGCFSTNDFKHISTGDGGIITVNYGSREDYERVHAFADKNYSRFESNVTREPSHLAPNYRMTELQGAVGIAQLKKLPWICRKRNELGTLLTDRLKGLTGITPMEIEENSECTYWFYMFRIDLEELGCTREEFSEFLREEGIPNQAGYIPKPLYLTPLFQRKEAYPGSTFPFHLSDVSYQEGSCPNAEEILKTAIKLPMSEFFTQQDMEETAAGINKAAHYFTCSRRAEKA
ncbi:DegT/DnrJ/EryC1/StrS family aminotransferase [Metabacillus sp. GX 13764]|uniref:DegT/DnrJ/EryC1/StrS family aminotransferase n=1 Tax=Metabacillus kandeliae TaxID=2900151 RepID=UPI001E36048B|nr:DegT/DnrJ/EryC1/StrS family aminotransferase [Metabacillus kandeliae]MCD7032973.1 DegT/DnrJ/EryC1/StrS family aminotransferase [Metabacillus kandeliae]